MNRYYDFAPSGLSRGWSAFRGWLGGLLDNKPTRVALIAVGIVFVYALPLLNLPVITTSGVDFGGVMFDAAAYALIAVGLNIVIGYAGLLDLGYVGFYAIGAYTTGILTTYHFHWPFLLALPVAIAVTMLSGLILGAPTLRVRGDYLAIVTLGFGEIIRLVIVNTHWLGAAQGIDNIPAPPNIGPNAPGQGGGLFQVPHLSWGTFPNIIDVGHKTPFLKFGPIDAIPFYWMIVTAFFIVIIADILVKNSRVGRAWEATREDEDAAELMGVPTFKFKLLAFALGAAVGGLSGAFYATRNGFISPATFLLLLSELFVAAVIVGGAGNRWGAAFGGVLVAYLPDRFRSFSDWRMLVFGLALMALAIWRPQGIFPPRRTRRALAAEAQIEELEGEAVDV
ncbi:branched-chain amino acid ABC transporter permease [Nocardioides sp. Iso805N]|uniref:branched-chain amino acid ABC transporter permease n=1 Tax=Nocardioides sp. Iso805N TaxID=1283287 RepID=UPI0003A4B146|nr:branched-chain amino acid ABC transporter permease [Nocardioides sp. Iso805N]